MFIYVRNDSFLQSIDEVIYASHVENTFQIIGEAEHAHFCGDLFKALNLLPSIEMKFLENSFSLWQNLLNSLKVFSMAFLLSFLKSDIVLKSGASLHKSHMTSILQWHSRASFLEERTA